MDQVAMNAPVTVLQWMSVDEAERKHRSRNHRIKLLCRAHLESEHPLDQCQEIFGSCTYMLRQRHSRYPVMLTDESTLDAETHMNKSRISNHHLLQSQ